MAIIFRFSRWFGVAGSGNAFWKTFGLCILLLLGFIEGVAIWRVVKALAGWAIDTEGHRSVTVRLAGATFYASSITTLILSWKLSSSWETIASYWSSIDRSVAINVPTDKKIRTRMITVTSVMVTCVVVEHAMSMMSQVGFDCPPSLILKRYTLMSHGFLLLRTDYSLSFAVPLLFMSKIATILWNYQDILIVLISMGLTSRYNTLNQYVAKSSSPCKDFPWNSHDECSKGHTWRRIREAYVKQAQLVRRLDESLGGLILLSNLVNFYFICLQLFLGITQGLSGDLIKRLYYVVSLVWLCVRVSCVVLAAADINVHSTKALQHLYASDSHHYNIEIVRLRNQLSKDYIALSGLGFFSLNRTILLQVHGRSYNHV
ncbi:gustatory receptor for sugar taste 64a-like [Leguminivora glycinivorella]|uniref:gustatory receptor for sugar taste 64a-like n=1 Tax=Leguminivora glycinivorella TaxID=1035111 RepID=UPI00200BC5D8|nr:gustatory receptor for sugar taste 64a-like [Leguminivora glycinivorella]